MISVRIDFLKNEKVGKTKEVGIAGSIVGLLDNDCDLFTDSEVDSSTESYVDVKGKTIYYTDVYTLFKTYDNIQITKVCEIS
jgi:hypothetical protein